MISTKNIISFDFVTRGLKDLRGKIQNLNKDIRTANTQIVKNNLAQKKLSASSKIIAEGFRNAQIATKGYREVMKMNSGELANFNKKGYKFTTLGGRIANRFRLAAHGLRGFRMEMLGVMFFGMSLQRTFFGLIKTSMDWLGVTEIMSTALGVLFLPVAELLLDWALAFLNWVLKLTPAQKKWIGILTLTAAAIGGILMVIGILTLGIGSLILAFSWLFNPIVLIVGALVAFVTAAWLIPSVLKAISGRSDEVKEKLNTLGIGSEVFTKLGTAIDTAHTKLKEFLSEHVPSIFGNLSTDTEELSNEKYWKTAAMNIINGLSSAIKSYLEENPLMVLGGIIGMFAGGPFGAMLGSAIGKGVQKIDWEKIDPLIEAGIEMATRILDGLVAKKEIISDALSKLIEAMGEWIHKNEDKLIDLGLAIGGAILKGVVKAFENMFSSPTGFGVGGGALGGAAIGTAILPGFGTIAGGIMGGVLGGAAVKGADIRSKRGESVLGIRTPLAKGGLLAHDFILQPGGRLIRTDPQDTIMGRKGGFGSGGIVVNATYNVTVSDKREFENMLRDNNNKMVEDVRRLIEV